MKLSVCSTLLIFAVFFLQCNAHPSKLRGENNHSNDNEEQEHSLATGDNRRTKLAGKAISESDDNSLMGAGDVTVTVWTSIPRPTEAPVQAPMTSFPVTASPVTASPVTFSPVTASPITTPPVAMISTTSSPVAVGTNTPAASDVVSGAPVDDDRWSIQAPVAPNFPSSSATMVAPTPTTLPPVTDLEENMIAPIAPNFPSLSTMLEPTPTTMPPVTDMGGSIAAPLPAPTGPASATAIAPTFAAVTPGVGSCAKGGFNTDKDFAPHAATCFGGGECGDGLCCIWPYCRCGLKPNPKMFPVIQCLDDHA